MKFKNRVDDLVKNLKAEDLDAVILGNSATIRYFTGLRFNTAAFSMLFVSKVGDVVFLVPTLDYKRVKQTCWIKDIISFPEDNPNYLEPLRGILQDKIVKRIGVEFSTITMDKEILIKEITNAKLVNVENKMLELRAVKDKDEIEIIKASVKIAEMAMNEAMSSLKEGIKEYEISAIAQSVMMKKGAETLSFEPFVMIGENSWLPQRFSTSKELKLGEMGIFDMGCVYEGYCSDITRTFSLGGLTDEQKHIFDIAYKAQQKAIKAVKPGVTAEDIDEVARSFISENGYGKYFPHITGHGVGLSVHEAPIIDVGDKTVLKPNMVITIEPGIYIEGVGAARVEDMVLVTDDGYELLTNAPRELERRLI